MGYHAKEIANDLTSGVRYVSATRTPDNYFFVAYYDPEQSPKATRVKYSTDDGDTWAAEDFSQAVGTDVNVADGGTDPCLMCDTRGNLWMGMSNFDGNNKPSIIYRDPQELNWGGLGRGGLHVLSNDTSVSDFVCKLDSHHCYGGGYGWENMCGIWIKSGAIRYADLFNNTENVDTTGTPAEPRLAVSSGGTRWVAFRDGTTAYMRSKDGRTGAWSSRIQVSQGGETVLSVEDIAIHSQRDQPSVIYRISDGGKQKLMLAEYHMAIDSPYYAWVHTRVWNGSNEDNFYTGNKLSYDGRGSVYVHALCDYNALGKAESCQFALIRAMGISAWTMSYYTSGALADVPEQIALYNLHPNINNVRLNAPWQGTVCFTWTWGDQVPTGKERLFWINFDRHDSNSGTYPTIFERVTGEQPYRPDPNPIGSTIPSATFAGEGSASGTFPGIKAQATYREQKVFITSVFKTEANYTARVSMTPSGRSFLDIEFTALTATQLSTLETFLWPRQKDKTAFYYSPPPDYAPGSQIVVKVLGKNLKPRLVGPGIWALRFQLLEVK